MCVSILNAIDPLHQTTKTIEGVFGICVNERKPNQKKESVNNPNLISLSFYFFYIVLCANCLDAKFSVDLSVLLTLRCVFAIQEKAHESQTYLFRSLFFEPYITEIIGLFFNAINGNKREL